MQALFRHRIVAVEEKQVIMKKLLFFILVLIAGGALAQTPVPNADTVDPVQQGDPAVRHLPPRSDYVDDRRQIGDEELPQSVRESLENDAALPDLKDAEIFHDRKRNEYIVEIEKQGKRITYRFDAQGKRILEE